VVVLELTCVALIVMYVLATLLRGGDRAGFLRRMLLLVVASWLTENSVIHAYGFYAYSPEWSVFVDRVPLMVIVIWPMVIHSSWLLARRLLGEGHRAIPLVGGAMVFADASLIEPVSVKAGLWWWTHPGLFEVPIIGVLGWALFAGLCMAVFERWRGRPGELTTLALAPLGTHLLLLASWWGCFRWIEGTIPAWPAVALVWLVSVLLTTAAIRRRVFDRMPLGELLLRVPAALFFFVLLGLYGRGEPALVAWVAAFAPPYCAITPWLAMRRGAVANPG